MERQDLQRLLRQRPFQPFRVLLADGRAYEIRNPDMNLLAHSYIKIGIPETGSPTAICDHTEFVRLSWITDVELIPAAADSLPS